MSEADEGDLKNMESAEPTLPKIVSPKKFFEGFKKPVHVAVLCPPGAAVTALLNKMGEHNGSFVLMQQIPLQVGSISKANGQGNVQLFPLLVFAILQSELESWLKISYDPVAMYNMDDVMQDRAQPAPQT